MADTLQTREYSSNVVRVLHPTQTYSKSSNHYNIETNTENMLEDLNSSIANAANTIKSRTVRSSYPEKTKEYRSEKIVQDGNRTYHTAENEYSVSYDDMGQRHYNENGTQLDTLLDDLKNERELSMNNTIYHHSDSNQQYKNVTAPLLNQSDVKVYKTKNIYKNTTTTNNSNNNNVGGSNLRTVDHLNNFPNIGGGVNEVIYNTTSTTNNSLRNTNKIITTGTDDIPQEIKEIALADDILPIPGTKVTTTVRTYTYEVPHHGGSISPPHGIVLNNTTTSNNYNTIDERRHNIINDINTTTYKSNLISNPPILKNNNITETTIIDKNSTTHNQNYNMPPGSGNNNNISPLPNPPPDQFLPSRTYYYKNVSSNTKNTVYGGGSPRDNNNYPNNMPYDGNLLPNSPPREMKYLNEPVRDPNYPNRSPRDSNFSNSPVREIIYTHSPAQSPPSNDSNTVIYRHTHTSTSTTNNNNNDKYYPNNDHINGPPVPFPTDETDKYNNQNHTPKRLDDLMASFGNGPTDRRHHIANETEHKVEVDTSVASPGKPTVEPRALSKNIQGPPVYYPPGQEMSMKKEQSSAAYSASGGYAKASGKYEYEAESKSKSKSRSGAAVVPVCLPLCCAMPCSIM